MGFTVAEQTTRRYTATIQDETGAAIPAASLTTLKLTLYDRATGAVINTRDDQNVLNANDVTVDGNGLLTWTMKPADNPILNDALAQEHHVALFEFTYASGAKRGQHEVDFVVRNASKVP